MKYLESLQVPVPDSNSRRRRWQEIEASGGGESDSDDLLQLMLTPVVSLLTATAMAGKHSTMVADLILFSFHPGYKLDKNRNRDRFLMRKLVMMQLVF